jgi:arabinan endo-1,5-alpha-L-arabinosidase
MCCSKLSPAVCSGHPSRLWFPRSAWEPRQIARLFLLLLVPAIALWPTASLAQQGDVRRVHDPHIIKQADAYYIFCTGRGIPIRRSTDLYNWKIVGRVFEQLPDWARQEIPGARDFWASDVLLFNGKYHVYYSISTFGSNRSCIGLVTNATLDSESRDYKWVDQGKVIESLKTDDFNCIDANPVMDEQKNVWLGFGSFWGGIKLRRLYANTGKVSAADDKLYSLAARPKPDPRPIEAAYIIRHGDYYYLFASFDFCCRGVKSNYNIRVGRAQQITGPYSDREGKPMLEGGGTLILETAGRYIGPGHNSVLHDGEKDYLVHHFYDGENRGIATLQIRPLTWTQDGWPVAGDPITGPQTSPDAKPAVATPAGDKQSDPKPQE